MSLTIIGCGLCPDDLTETIKKRINDAQILAGGQRLLEWFPDHQSKRVALDAHARHQAAELLRFAQESEVVVLASGDPLFFGIAATFLSLQEKTVTEGLHYSSDEGDKAVEIEIVPNISALQGACAHLGQAWSELEFFNLHGRISAIPWRRILRSSGALILAGPGEQRPQLLAAALIDLFPLAKSRQATVFCDLGRAEEKVFTGTLAQVANKEFSALSLLFVAPAEEAGKIPPLALGLPRTEFEYEAGLITKEEVRAVILAKLRLVPGIMWDLGAGSGSVAIEAVALNRGLKVWAVEKDPDRVQLINNNALKQGCLDNLEIISCEILGTLEKLPDPDRIFIGGGGRKLSKITQKAFSRLAAGGILVATAVTLESRAALSDILVDECLEVVEINIARSQPLGRMRLLKSENPIAIYVFRKN
ncbi:MAG: precorrin-6y C5,15-methyltransferase (decarboxylating) subunit CbiE [Deltaproteobacteria bacterium]|nr:precorrin-6y C5,15-methyltransferase (decarboxylating) subunit CbiE [Candidatus Tharpella sp.]